MQFLANAFTFLYAILGVSYQACLQRACSFTELCYIYKMAMTTTAQVLLRYPRYVAQVESGAPVSNALFLSNL